MLYLTTHERGIFMPRMQNCRENMFSQTSQILNLISLSLTLSDTTVPSHFNGKKTVKQNSLKIFIS